MAAERRPRVPRGKESELVADFAETAQLHGYNVTQHTVSHNHERDETKLSVTFVKASGGEKQTVLQLKKNGGDDPGE
jgi:hypothetical protein